MNRSFNALVLALALLTPACGYSSKYMAQLETPQALQVDPSAATVVIARPSGYGGGVKSAILDSRMGFLGESSGKSYFVTKLPPGEHTFVAWSEGTPALKATVEAGKIYYVEVGFIIGIWSGRARLFAVGPQRQQWAELPTWLRDSKMLVLQPGAQDRFVQDKGGDMTDVIRKGLTNYAEYDAEERAKRTLTPADGVAAPVQ